MEIYWSAVQMLRNSPDATVDATSPTVRFIKRRNTEVILPNIPLAAHCPTETHGTKDQPNRIHHARHASRGNQAVQIRITGFYACAAVKCHEQALEIGLNVFYR